MNTLNSRGRCCSSSSCLLIVSLIVLGCATSAAAQGPLRISSPAVAPPAIPHDNVVRIGFATPFVDGDRAQFIQRHRLPGTTNVGLEDLHLERFVGASGLLTIDGRAVLANHDYFLGLDYEDADVGFARGGFRSFRVWYDGSGGFFPKNAAWFPPNEDELAMDRGDAWFEGGVRLPSLPKVTLKYTRRFRKGEKPSLAWGDSNEMDGAGTRSISPSFWKSDEVRNIFEGTVEQALGKTDLELGVRYEASDISNARNMLRRPGEAPERYVTDEQGAKSDLFHVHAFTKTRLLERVILTSSYSFTSLENDLLGNRIYGADYEPIYDPLFEGRQYRDHAFLDLTGTTKANHHIGSLNLLAAPFRNLTFVPSVRVEQKSIDGTAGFVDTAVERDMSMLLTPISVLNERSLLDFSGSVEARYTGVANMLLYTRGDWLQGQGDLSETEMLPQTGEIDFHRTSDDLRYSQKYTVGANWYPLRRLNVGVQAYHKHRAANYEHPENEAGPTRYPGFLTAQDYTTVDANARLRWRPINGIMLSSRYDYQRSTIRADAAELSRVRSALLDRRILSNTVTWTATPQLYVQANLNYILSTISSPANDAGEGATDVVLESKNDYVNASVVSGLVLSDRFDVEAQYFYYFADDYFDNSLTSLPLEAGAEEHGLSAGMGWHVTPALRWTARYVVFINRDQPSGARDDYDLHLIYSGLQYRF